MAALIALAGKAVTAIGGLGKTLAVGGTILSGAGQIAAGNSQNAAAKYEAKQLEARATAERAAAQRDAEKERRQKELVLSRARAVGAASGGGIDINLMGKIEEEGERNALLAMWEGEERARGAQDQAAATRWGGKMKKQGAYIGAMGSVLKVGHTLLDNADMTMLEKYGRLDGPTL